MASFMDLGVSSFPLVSEMLGSDFDQNRDPLIVPSYAHDVDVVLLRPNPYVLLARLVTAEVPRWQEFLFSRVRSIVESNRHFGPVRFEGFVPVSAFRQDRVRTKVLLAWYPSCPKIPARLMPDA